MTTTHHTTRHLAIGGILATLAIIVGAILGLQDASHARGEGNRMTWYDFNENLIQGQSQANAEGFNGCSCTGVKIRTWTGDDGDARKQVQYTDTAEQSAYVTYRLESGVWRTTVRMWGADGYGFNVKW